MANKTATLTAKQARALTGRIQKQWRDLEELLTEAIVHNVWAPLGYDSFAAWYDAEMYDIPLARGARNLVIITMFAEQTQTKITNQDIAEMISAPAFGISVSPAAVKQVRESWNAGLLPFVPPLQPVSADPAKPKRRKWTRQFRWMGVRVKIELHDELQTWGRANGKSLRVVQEEAFELYADLNIRKGVEPTPEERKPSKRASTRARLPEKPKFQPPEEPS